MGIQIDRPRVPFFTDRPARFHCWNPPTIDADLKYVKGRLDAMPTTIQLLGFIIAIFVATGVTRFFGH